MIFTLGNIITFAVLTGIILLFRQLDSKNRSIDKVKKFTDKIKTELDTYFENRNNALHNAALDLEVKQTQAIATVKRLEMQRSDFSKDDTAIAEKLAALSKIEESIKSYDKIIEQLMGMTDRADENLQKIAVEASRLDRSQKKVSELHEKLDKISDSIPQLTSDFARQNSEQMKMLGSGIITNFESKASALQARFESSETTCSNLLVSVENAVQTSFTNAARQAAHLEHSAFENLQKDIRQHQASLLAEQQTAVAAVSADIEAKLNAVHKTHERAIESIKNSTLERAETAESQLSARLSSLEGDLSRRLDDFETFSKQESSGFIEAIREEIRDFSLTYEDVSNNLGSNLNELTKVSGEKIGSITERLEEAERQFSRLSTDYEDKTTSLERSIELQLASIKNTIETEFAELSQNSETRVTGVSDSFKEKVSNMQHSLESQLASIKNTIETEFAELSQNSETRVTDVSCSIEEKVSNMQHSLESQFALLSQNSENLFDGIENKYTDKVDALRVSIESQLESVEQDSTVRLAGIESVHGENFSSLENSFNGRFTSLSGQFEKYAAEIESRISSSYLDASGNIEKTQSRIFAEIEKHFETYKFEMLYRFERIEKAASDIDLLDVQLHETMELAKNRVSTDFDGFAKEQEKRQMLFEKSAQEKVQGLSQYMQRIERELNELKSLAYDNVSEKLKIFEDDFFADLNKRSDSINSSLIHWKSDIESNLNVLAAESENERHKIEQKYTEDVKNQLAQINEKMREQFARTDETLKKTEQEGLRRIEVSEETISRFIERSHQEFETAKHTSEEYLKREFDNYNSVSQEYFRKQQDEITASIRDLSEETAAARSGAGAALDSVRDDFIMWRERVTQQFEEARAVFEEKLSGLEKNSSGIIAQVSESFKADADSYASVAREEKLKLSAELDTLREHMKIAAQSFQTRSEETVDEFSKSYESMLEETQRRIREQNSESEQKLRSLKVMAQEIQEKNEESRQKMVLKMQTDTSNLQMVMDDIDKRLKSFVSQTHLFERADSLKQHLEEQIAALRSDTGTLDSFKKTASELEQQFIKIRRMDEELNQKLQRFSGDRKRIEAMEADFNNLMALSNTIDQKITELKSTGDDLQNIQFEIRRFQETLSEISSRYERLEKKNDILERTIMGVDKTFETLNQLEKRLVSCSQQTEQLPLRLSELNGSVDRILENDAKIHDAAAKLDSLENILTETENRMQSMHKSREWLAKTETRLEEINKQAQSQVKILGDLLKKDGTKKDPSAPPVSLRETVTKLAHQGWKIDEIARGTHLSRSEVELILELGNDSK